MINILFGNIYMLEDFYRQNRSGPVRQMEENEDPCEAVKAPGQEVRERPDLLLYRGEFSPLAYIQHCCIN